MLIVQRPTIHVEDATDEAPNRAKFAIEPLDPGFGYTLGNALRRTLLSSIPGAAVTAIRIDGVQHEFSSIPGVKEDTIDVILNIKALVLKSVATEPITLTISAKGPTDLKAGDIQPHAECTIVNPDLHIATLNSKGRLEIDLTVEQGRGYVTAEGNKRGGAIGIIPIDSIFSPVRRVAYAVEPTQVGQQTDFDRLILDIETDGSISPRDAISSAGETLGNLVGLFAAVGEGAGLELGEALDDAASSPDLDLPIEQLELSERPRNCLKRGQINTIGELIKRTEQDLLGLTNFGQKSLDEVIAKLDELGLSLAKGE